MHAVSAAIKPAGPPPTIAMRPARAEAFMVGIISRGAQGSRWEHGQRVGSCCRYQRVEDMCMRIAGAIVLALVMAGCATTRPAGPREYLDEQTAATITVVSDPWIFTRERFGAKVDEQDFLNLYGIDVNRQGDHRQYIAVLQS